MNGDMLLVVVGLSAGTGSAVGWWAALWWRDRVPRSLRYLTRRIYRHVDETLGTRATENNRRTKMHARIAFWISPKWANLLAPRAQLSGAAAMPSIRRMGRYVKLSPDRRTVVLRYTSEAAANGANFVEWLERGRPGTGGGLAQALGLEWKAGMFEVTRDWSKDLVTFTRVKLAAVDDDLRAEEDLG
jgi:hypothetical protein